jgi:APA family basic amino acid/polyamine antiporter
LSMLGYLSGAILAAPRNLFAFGRDGFLPKQLAAVHPRHRTPHVSIVTYTLVAAALAISETFEQLAVLAVVTVLTLYLLCAVSAWVLRRRDVRAGGEPFRVPGGPLVPALACGVIVSMLVQTVGRREVIAVGVVLALALAAYTLRRHRLRALAAQ